jgi:hypothetical protein
MPSPGIGAAGILGIAREVLAPPVQSALSTSASGGTIAAGTYKYVVTAINANGETTISNEQTIVTTGSTSTVTVTWASVTGATGYKLYKTAAGGATGTELLYKTVGVVLTDTDIAPGTPTGAFPTLNSASNSGVYAAPTKFIPFMSESLTSTQATIWRRPIRHPLFFLFGSRMSIAKTGTSPNFIYTCTPTANAIPNNTLSITVVRNGIVFGFTGCVVTSQTFTQNDGIFMYNMSIIGRDEAVQSLPTATWPTTVPFGAGQWSIEIPTATPVFDTDTFEFTIDDGADPQFRLKNTTRGADFIKYGERALTMTMERDFLDRTDFDAFKALTSQTITITASKGANNSISMNAPAAIKDTYEVTNSGQGDLVRASLAYNGVIDGTGKSYQVILKTQENVL